METDGRIVYYPSDSFFYDDNIEKTMQKLKNSKTYYKVLDIIDYFELKQILEYLNSKESKIQKNLKS